MQFGSLTVDQWDHHLASLRSSDSTNNPPDLLSLASKTTPPPSPPKLPNPSPATHSSQLPPQPSASTSSVASTTSVAAVAATSPPSNLADEAPTTAILTSTTNTANTNTQSPSTNPATPSLPHASPPVSPPRPLTWAARVAGVASSPHHLPPPRPIPRLSYNSPASASASASTTASIPSQTSLSSSSLSLPPIQSSQQSVQLSSPPRQSNSNNNNIPTNNSSHLPTAPVAPSSKHQSTVKQVASKSPPLTTSSVTSNSSLASPPGSAVSNVPSSNHVPVQSTSHPYTHPPRRRRTDPSCVPPRGLRGLINGGNCCFINVVLQALLACNEFRLLLQQCAEAPAGSLIQKFVMLADLMESGGLANGHAPHKHRNGQPTGLSNGKPPSENGKSPPVQLLSMKEGTLVKEEPILADWFYDVFPSSGSVGGQLNGHLDKSNSTGRVMNKQNLSSVIGNGVMNHGSGSQEDAEEFLTYVLNALHEEMVEWEGRSGTPAAGTPNGMNEAVSSEDYGISTVDGRIHTMNGGLGDGRNKDEDNVWTEMTRSGKGVEIRGGEFAQSGVTEIFGGALRSEVKRVRGKASVTREPFFSLSLDIESGLIRDVEHALLGYFEPEILEGYSSGDGSAGGEARKHVLLMQTPQTLILHLKRFSHNSITGALNKVTRNMMFPEVLRVPGKVMHKAGSRWGQDTGPSYQLKAVVTHVGKELAGGHYTADVRWDNGKGESAWFMCDDSKIVASSWQKVCRKQAYLLFYCAI